MEAVAALLKIFMGLALIHFQKYWLLRRPCKTLISFFSGVKLKESILLMIWLEFHLLQEATHHIFFQGFKGKVITFLLHSENIKSEVPKKSFINFVNLFIQVNKFQKAPFDHHFMKKFNRLFYTALLQHVEFSFKSFGKKRLYEN